MEEIIIESGVEEEGGTNCQNVVRKRSAVGHFIMSKSFLMYPVMFSMLKHSIEFW